jgi:hypothetical protein
VIVVLVDHNLEGEAALLWDTLADEGWLELVPIQRLTLPEVGLSLESSDRVVWRSAQARGMLLLTGNRNMKGEDSLEQTLREESTPDSLPVLTIGTATLLREPAYRERCAERLMEIALDLERYRGVGRVFVP